MTALVASSSAEWEMVYMVSCVAMPTITALVVMLARWKGKKVPNSSKLLATEGEANSEVPTKKRNAETRAERNERLIRRVTSCPDFAVVRVVKASGNMPRQVSFTNLKDRKLQEEISKLADKLLNNAEQTFEGERKGCGWEMRGLRKSMQWRAKLRAEKITKIERKREAEEFCMKGSPSEKEGEVNGAADVGGSIIVSRKSVEASKVEKKRQDASDIYDRMRLGFCSLEWRNTCQNTFVKLENCSIVRYWGQPEGADEQTRSGRGGLLWSVNSQGVVESWDSRAGHMPMLSHCVTLPSSNIAATRVDGLIEAWWELRIRLACGREIKVDGRKLL